MSQNLTILGIGNCKKTLGNILDFVHKKSRKSTLILLEKKLNLLHKKKKAKRKFAQINIRNINKICLIKKSVVL